MENLKTNDNLYLAYLTLLVNYELVKVKKLIRIEKDSIYKFDKETNEFRKIITISYYDAVNKALLIKESDDTIYTYKTPYIEVVSIEIIDKIKYNLESSVDECLTRKLTI